MEHTIFENFKARRISLTEAKQIFNRNGGAYSDVEVERIVDYLYALVELQLKHGKADRVQWNFGDGSTSTDWAPVHTNVHGSTFLVELTAYLGDEVAHAFRLINITSSDLQLALVQDTRACKCDLPVNYNFCNGANIRFQQRLENVLIPATCWRLVSGATFLTRSCRERIQKSNFAMQMIL